MVRHQKHGSIKNARSPRQKKRKKRYITNGFNAVSQYYNTNSERQSVTWLLNNLKTPQRTAALSNIMKAF